jgi:hypothetical protein
MAGLLGSQCKGKERPDGQGDSYILHVIHMDQDIRSPKAQEHFSRDSCSGRLRALNPPDFTSCNTTMQHQRLQELTLSVTQGKDEHDPSYMWM